MLRVQNARKRQKIGGDLSSWVMRAKNSAAAAAHIASEAWIAALNAAEAAASMQVIDDPVKRLKKVVDDVFGVGFKDLPAKDRSQKLKNVFIDWFIQSSSILETMGHRQLAVPTTTADQQIFMRQLHPSPYTYVDTIEEQKGIYEFTSRQEVEAEAAEVVRQVKAFMDAGCKTDPRSKHHKARFITEDKCFFVCRGCDCILPNFARPRLSNGKFAGSQCLLCANADTNFKEKNSLHRKLSQLINHAYTRHKEKTGKHGGLNEDKDAFGITLKLLCQKIIDQRGFCAIFGNGAIVPLSLNPQCPRYISIEDVDGIGGAGYSTTQGSWSVGCQMFNLPSRPTCTDFGVLMRLMTKKIEKEWPKWYVQHDITPCPCRYSDDEKKYNRWYRRTLNGMCKIAKNNCRNSDKARSKTRRQWVVGENYVDVTRLYQAQRGKCALTGLPFLHETLPRKDEHGAFCFTVDRIDNNIPHVHSNCRLVLAFFNPPDFNQQRKYCPAEGQFDPYTYSWTKQDIQNLMSVWMQTHN